MEIISCSHGKHIAKKIAKKLKQPYSELEVTHFPDSEIKLRFRKDVKGKTVALVQSFYGNVNDCVIEALFAAETARDLGARKIILVAPYFPYLRQDKRFNPGECISLRTIAKNIDEDFDKIYVMDPHLHREKTLKHIFRIGSRKLTANPLITKHIKNIRNALIIGPDEESYKWAEKVADEAGCECAIMKKERRSAYDVTVSLNKKISLKDKNIIIVDDMISTGNTIIETVKLLKKLGGRRFTVICVHGIFAGNALQRLRKNRIDVAACNTIPNKAEKIDVSGVIADSLR
ncbi:ribose-phosphate diphosphokinase [Candidatus Woesearchaeota archaeon]|nr:ribose-phosphate diphosphokinase [Candidatus Woesearchaeota archaeon]